MFRHHIVLERSQRSSATFLLYSASQSFEIGKSSATASTAAPQYLLDQPTEKACDSEAEQRSPTWQLVELSNLPLHSHAQRTQERHHESIWSHYADFGAHQAEDAASNVRTLPPPAVSQIVSIYESASQMTVEYFPRAGGLQWDVAPSDAAASQLTAESFHCANASEWDAAASHETALQMTADSSSCAGGFQWDVAPSDAAASQMTAETFHCVNASEWDAAASHEIALQMTADSSPCAGGFQWDVAPSDAVALWPSAAPQSALYLSGVPHLRTFTEPQLVPPCAVGPQVPAESSGATSDERTTLSSASTMKRNAPSGSWRVSKRKPLADPRMKVSRCARTAARQSSAAMFCMAKSGATPSLIATNSSTVASTVVDGNDSRGNGRKSSIEKGQRRQFLLKTLLALPPTKSQGVFERVAGRMCQRLEKGPPWLERSESDDRLRKWAKEKSGSLELREVEFLKKVCGVSPFIEHWLKASANSYRVVTFLTGLWASTEWNIYKITATLEKGHRKVFIDLQHAVAKACEGSHWDKTKGRVYCYLVMRFFAEKLLRLVSGTDACAASAAGTLACFSLVETIITNYAFRLPHCQFFDCGDQSCKEVDYWSAVQGIADSAAPSFYVRALQELLPPHIAKAMGSKDATGKYQHMKLKQALTSWLERYDPSADIDNAISTVSEHVGKLPSLQKRKMSRFSCH